MVRTEAVLEGWKTVRKDTIQAVLDMPTGDLGFQAAPDMMSFRDLALHNLNAGRALSRVLLDNVDMTAPGFRDKMKSYYVEVPADASAADLARILARTIDEDCAALAAMPPEFFAGLVTKWDGQTLTRLEMVQFTKEHELVHRAQMFMCLRLKGVIPPTTRRRMAKT